jgi:hypothetical protein
MSGTQLAQNGATQRRARGRPPAAQLAGAAIPKRRRKRTARKAAPALAAAQGIQQPATATAKGDPIILFMQQTTAALKAMPAVRRLACEAWLNATFGGTVMAARAA